MRQKSRPREISGLTDVANAVAKDLTDIVYVPEIRRWRQYTPEIGWEDIDKSHVIVRISAWLDRLADKIASEPSPTQRTELSRVHRWRRHYVHQEIMYSIEMRPGRRVSLLRWDQPKHGLLCANGMLLAPETGEVQPCLATHYISRGIPVVYDPEAKAPGFERFLQEIQPDPKVRDYLQQAAGITLTGNAGYEVMWILLGPAATGKSQFLLAIATVLDRYAVQLSPHLAMYSKGSDRISQEFAKLVGARMAMMVEPEWRRGVPETLLKQLSSVDTLTGRKLRTDPMEFKPTHHLWIAANDQPPIRDADSGIRRRLKTIHFGCVVPERKREINIGIRLAREEGSGILNWIIEGVKRIGRDGIIEHACITHTSVELLDNMDIFGQFVEECLEADPTSQVSADDLLLMCRHWYKTHGYKAIGMDDLQQKLVNRGFPSVKQIAASGLCVERAHKGLKLKEMTSVNVDGLLNIQGIPDVPAS